MNILENEIEEVVWQALTTNLQELQDREFPCSQYDTYVRQLNLANYGIADIVGFRVGENEVGEKYVYAHIIELKKDKITPGTLLQAVRYAKGIEQKMDKEGIKRPVSFSISLIGKEVDMSSDFVYMTDVISDVDLYTYNIDLVKGITFKQVCGYSLTNEGFNPKSKDIFHILKKNVKQVWNFKEARRKYYAEKYPDGFPF